MSIAFEGTAVLHNYQDNFPFLSQFDPVSVVRAVMSELKRTVTVFTVNNGDGSFSQFGREIVNVVAIEYAKLDPTYVLSRDDGLTILSEAKKMALELLDVVRSQNEWVRFDFTVLTAAYLRSNLADVGVIIRYTEQADSSVFNGYSPIEVSDYVVSSTRIVIGR